MVLIIPYKTIDNVINFRRASLFLVQDDKDLVHEFVNNDGLDCLIKVGSEADQNYQNYILRGKYFCLCMLGGGMVDIHVQWNLSNPTQRDQGNVSDCT